MAKQFTVAGIATDAKGNTKVRYANNMKKRIVTLFNNKFTNINFVELPNPMSKLEASNYILDLEQFSSQKSVIESEVRKLNKKVKVTADDILNAIKMRKPLTV